MATVLPFNSPPSPHTIEQAVACVQEGGVLAVPTDSYYALAVGIFQPAALEQLRVIKGNRDRKPFPVLIGDPSQLDQLVDHVPEIATKLMQQFWPGLLTVVLKAKPHVSPVLMSESGTIGVRQPNHSLLCNLLMHTGPLTGTSANRTGQAPAMTVENVQHQLGADIDLILDGGPTPGGQPSTVLQVEPELRLLRQGEIPLSAIQNVLGNGILAG
ncbi:MAG: L-threonylcarbamoyladenylate synthase [Nitrospirota bacterium]|nr:L-threonylcarbamoyladenylate synthase [Nitrospirota bacterium]